MHMLSVPISPSASYKASCMSQMVLLAMCQLHNSIAADMLLFSPGFIEPNGMHWTSLH